MGSDFLPRKTRAKASREILPSVTMHPATVPLDRAKIWRTSAAPNLFSLSSGSSISVIRFFT